MWGIGVQKNPELAADLFRQAASKGNGTAAAYLGDMYYFGDGLKQDRAEAEKWFSLGVKVHDPVACYNLGLLYSGQDGHKIDRERSANLLRESATAGYVPAMSALGLELSKHPDLALSPQEASDLLQAAAAAGSWRSSMVLGMLARDGNGMAQDLEAAFYHFQVAVLQGGEAAQTLLQTDLNRLSQGIDADTLAEITRKANAWYQQHLPSLAFIYKDGGRSKEFPLFARAAAAQWSHAGQLLPLPPN
jgi:TPR repeat protein